MTTDEIIVKETKIAKEFQKVIDTHMVSEDMTLEEMYCDDTEVIEEHLQRCKELSDYHNTIANTMHKYKKIKRIIKAVDDRDIGYATMMDALHKVVEDGNDKTTVNE